MTDKRNGASVDRLHLIILFLTMIFGGVSAISTAVFYYVVAWPHSPPSVTGHIIGVRWTTPKIYEDLVFVRERKGEYIAVQKRLGDLSKINDLTKVQSELKVIKEEIESGCEFPKLVARINIENKGGPGCLRYAILALSAQSYDLGKIQDIVNLPKTDMLYNFKSDGFLLLAKAEVSAKQKILPKHSHDDNLELQFDFPVESVIALKKYLEEGKARGNIGSQFAARIFLPFKSENGEGVGTIVGDGNKLANSLFRKIQTTDYLSVLQAKTLEQPVVKYR